MRKFLRDNGLTIVLTIMFSAFLIGQFLTGFRVYNDARAEQGTSAISVVSYMSSGHFIEATFENWESEYLQMGLYVLLTAFLFQRGSAESRDPDGEQDDPEANETASSPWPVKRGGLALKLYENSLTIALLALFVFSFVMHALGGARVYSEEQISHGGAGVTTLQYIRTSQFWFESFQNWQSEMLAVASLVVLSIFLRQRDSPESKPVEAAHGETGA